MAPPRGLRAWALAANWLRLASPRGRPYINHAGKLVIPFACEEGFQWWGVKSDREMRSRFRAVRAVASGQDVASDIPGREDDATVFKLLRCGWTPGIAAYKSELLSGPMPTDEQIAR